MNVAISIEMSRAGLVFGVCPQVLTRFRPSARRGAFVVV